MGDFHLGPHRKKLIHWGRDKMAAILQTTVSNAFLEWKCMNLIKVSLKFVLKGPINNISIMVQIMAWTCPGDKPLSEAMMVCLPTHICITRPQWVNPSLVMKLEYSGRVGEWLSTKSFFRHQGPQSHLIRTYPLESVASLTQITYNLQVTINFKKKGIQKK